MKKAFPAIALILVLVLTVGTAAETLEVADGHDWTSWSEETKKAYVYGVMDVMTFLDISFETNFEEDVDIEKIIQKFKEEERIISKDDPSISELITAFNEYYDDHDLDDPLVKLLFKLNWEEMTIEG